MTDFEEYDMKEENRIYIESLANADLIARAKIARLSSSKEVHQNMVWAWNELLRRKETGQLREATDMPENLE